MNTDKNKNQESDKTNNSKKGNTDTGNNLMNDVQGDPGANNYTPQNRTDNEQDTEKKK